MTPISYESRARRWDRWLWGALLMLVAGWAAMLAWPRNAAEASADAVPWRQDIKQAMDDAQARQRPILLNFTADWCPPCQEMKAKVYSDAEFAAWLGEHFVVVKVDLTNPGPEEQRLSMEHQVQYIPTLAVLQPDGTPVARGGGYMSKASLQAGLAELLETMDADPPAQADAGGVEAERQGS